MTITQVQTIRTHPPYLMDEPFRHILQETTLNHIPIKIPNLKININLFELNF